MIKLKSINKQFHTKSNTVSALNDVSFEIKDEEIFGVIGKSGVGKSTLLKILSLQLKPYSGDFRFFGHDVAKLNAKEIKALIEQTSYIYQNFSLLYNKSVLDNIALPLLLRGISREERLKRAHQMLEFVGLSHKSDAYPITLSGGEAQRISIARALVTNPKVLFCDEPTSSLDEETAFEVLSLIKKVHQTFKPTIVFVSHQIPVIKYLCDRVLLLEDGKVKNIGKVRKITTLVSNYEQELWSKPND